MNRRAAASAHGVRPELLASAAPVELCKGCLNSNYSATLNFDHIWLLLITKSFITSVLLFINYNFNHSKIIYVLTYILVCSGDGQVEECAARQTG